MNIYVKKIWSLNPDKYKFIPYDKALKKYNEYIDTITKQMFDPLAFKGDFTIKNFDQWLKTEI